MQRLDAKTLLEKYRNGTCTEAEKALLEKWYLLQKQGDVPPIAVDRVDEVGYEVWHALPINQPARRVKLWPRMVAAAIIVLAIAGAGLYFLQPNRQNTQPVAKEYANDIKPGGYHATLTLANGNTISLTTAVNGKLADQSGVSVSKTSEGQLAYEPVPGQAATADNAFNIVTTPVGGEYQVSLPDGSKVWLNAASSLKYPVHFNGNERKVELTGEAYFEIAHDAARPFRVVSAKQVVQVLGTHFNINAYEDEAAVVTTLLQGSVQVTPANGKSLVITPGQHAVNKNSRLTAEPADVQNAIAWKSGKTQFANTDIKTIMRTLARWYDIEVDYQGAVPTEQFWGSVSRSKNISQVLRVMELTGDVHFKIAGRRITVMP
jgi:transmembrane sensor